MGYVGLSQKTGSFYIKPRNKMSSSRQNLGYKPHYIQFSDHEREKCIGLFEIY